MNDSEIERVRSYLLFVFQPHKLFTSSFHKETDLNTRTFLHNEVCRIYGCKRDVVESAIKKADESYKRKYGILASCDPYSDINEIYDIFTNLMSEVSECKEVQMPKIFTAKELREAADNFWVGGIICEVKGEDGRVVKHIKHDAIIAMLRQAADMMEKEERFEYAVCYVGVDGRRHISAGCACCLDAARRNILPLYKDCESSYIVRRSVGEWKEVTE